jgi:hypothetical protein
MNLSDLLLTYDDAFRDIKNASFQDYSIYVYGLSKPDGTVFYIGKGSKLRVFSHEWQALDAAKKVGRNPRKLATIRKLADSGEHVYYVLYAFFKEEASALELEKRLIHEIGIREAGGPLTNSTPGGESGRRLGDAAQSHADIVRAMTKTEDWRRKQKEGVARKIADPERRAKLIENFRAVSATESFHERKLEGIARRTASTTWRENSKNAQRKCLEESRQLREQCSLIRSQHKLKDWKFPAAMCSVARWEEELSNLLHHLEENQKTKDENSECSSIRL